MTTRTPRLFVAATSLAGAALLAFPGAARAERRSFAVVQDFDTQTESELEVAWTSTHVPDGAWEGEAELVYGVTRHLDVSFHQRVTTTPTLAIEGAPATSPMLALGATGARVRYRPVERGDWPVDARAELGVWKAPSTCALAAEPRLIAGRDLWRLRLVVNAGAAVDVGLGDPTLDCGNGTDVEVATAATAAAGIRTRVFPTLDAGIEGFGRVDDVLEDERVTRAWAGPTVSWAPSPRLWLTASAGIGLTDDADDVVVRVLLAVSP